MANTKTFFRNKSAGFYVTLVLIAASLITAAVYTALYGESNYMSWPAVGFLVGGSVVSLVLCCTKFGAGMANAVLAFADFIAALFYIYGIYFYVSIVLVGIQASSFNDQFRTCTGLFAVLLLANLVNVFLKQVKEAE